MSEFVERGNERIRTICRVCECLQSFQCLINRICVVFYFSLVFSV